MEGEKKLSQSQSVIIAVACIFIILPLVLMIVTTIIRITTHVSIEQAMESDVDDEIVALISEYTKDDCVVHQIGTEGDYQALAFSSISPASIGDTALVILQKTDDGYKIIYTGTDYTKEILAKRNIPDGLIKKVTSADIISDYSTTIMESLYNPKNKYPLLQSLPYSTDNMRISCSFDDLKDSDGTYVPIIIINGEDAAERKNAMYKIRNLGYDPGDYRITYTNFNNPFDKNYVERQTSTSKNPEEEQAP